MSKAARPDYVSFEMGDDAIDLASHLKAIGYQRFEVISQISFQQLNQHGVPFRIRRKLRHVLGRREPEHFTCEGRLFVRGHSSGPMGEATSGDWQPFDAMVRDWRAYPIKFAHVGGWFDLHAKLSS